MAVADPLGRSVAGTHHPVGIPYLAGEAARTPTQQRQNLRPRIRIHPQIDGPARHLRGVRDQPLQEHRKTRKHVHRHVEHPQHDDHHKKAHHNLEHVEPAGPDHADREERHQPPADVRRDGKQRADEDARRRSQRPDGERRCSDLGHQHNPHRPVRRPRNPVEHVDHAFTGADRIACAAHPDPIFQKNPGSDSPHHCRAQDCAGAGCQNHLARTDILGAPHQRRADQQQNRDAGGRFRDGGVLHRGGLVGHGRRDFRLSCVYPYRRLTHPASPCEGRVC